MTADEAWQLIASTWEFGGTATFTRSMSCGTVSVLWISLAAACATVADCTTCAWVSRLTVPVVRPLATWLAVPLVAVTYTDAVAL